MYISRNDYFNLDRSVRALGNVLTHMFTDIYEYAYHMTFKKAMKSYAKEFRDPHELVIDEAAFFRDVEDPFVQRCYLSFEKILGAKKELIIRYGFDEHEDFEDPEIILESNRYIPDMLVYKRSKSYVRLRGHYERTIADFIESLLMYAWAFTMTSYKIPADLKKQLKQEGSACFRILNRDDHNVELLVQLMLGLMEDLEQFRLLNTSKSTGRKAKPSSRKPSEENSSEVPGPSSSESGKSNSSESGKSCNSVPGINSNSKTSGEDRNSGASDGKSNSVSGKKNRKTPGEDNGSGQGD